MTVRPTHLGELLPVQAASTSHAHRSGGASATAQSAFAKALAGAAAEHKAAATSHTSKQTATMQAETQTKTPSRTHDEFKLRKGEHMSPVAGRAFAEIDGGDRDGLYVNTSDNARHGQTFTMTVRKGREFHIYGTGEDRVVVSLPVKHDRDADGSTAKTGGATPTVKAS